MNRNPNSLSNLLVQNPDLLLSCTSIENDRINNDHDYVSTGGVNEFPVETLVLGSSSGLDEAQPVERQFSLDQFIQQEETPAHKQNEITEELLAGLDFNIFELLQNEEPEMARLIDQASNLDSFCSYLPQISVNTTTKVLEDLTTQSSIHKTHSSSSISSLLMELNKANNEGSNSDEAAKVIFKQDDIPEVDSHQSEGCLPQSTSFKELCELLSIKRVPSESTNKTSRNQLGKLNLLTPHLTPVQDSKQSMKPSRVSLRLFQKRNIKKEPMDVEEQALQPTGASNLRERSKRRKKSGSLDSSSDSDDKSIDSKPLNSSNENSMDFSSFYGDQQNDSDQDSDEDMSSDEFSRGIKRRYSTSGKSSDLLNGHKPVKKESNKEAATRYRIKKMSEKEMLFQTRFDLEKENDSKRRQIELVQTEINYLKTILVQFILTKSVSFNNPNIAS